MRYVISSFYSSRVYFFSFFLYSWNSKGFDIWRAGNRRGNRNEWSNRRVTAQLPKVAATSRESYPFFAMGLGGGGGMGWKGRGGGKGGKRKTGRGGEGREKGRGENAVIGRPSVNSPWPLCLPLFWQSLPDRFWLQLIIRLIIAAKNRITGKSSHPLPTQPYLLSLICPPPLAAIDSPHVKRLPGMISMWRTQHEGGR